jgi:hypothetical protein
MMYEAARRLLPEIRAIGFPGSDLTENELLWHVIPELSMNAYQRACARMHAEHALQHECPVRPDGSCHWVSAAEQLDSTGDAALDALNRVKNAESAIAALSDPATVVENDPAAIEAYAAVKDCYEALTDYEKTLIDAELRGKYASFGRALTNYRVVAGDGSIWVEKSERDIAFEITCSAQRFMGVYVDGVQVMPERYIVSAKERNTVVVLSHDYLETLSTDSHTVLFLFEDGDAVAGIIVEAKPASGWLWLLSVPVLLIVGAAAYVLKIYLDRRNEKSIG